ncbi:hypothetical protein AB4Y44_39835 [Paraburkholderia sp. BR10937]|uniref:hypothetical protein n=1 Tax=Paraburkholderia sp. BR10937 TaxID=3236994 RepID=UPI0034D18A88
MSLYFAYGIDLQNTDWLAPAAALLKDQPPPQPSACGVIPDCALSFRRSTLRTNAMFCSLADVAGKSVWGLLINLPDNVLAALVDAKSETHERVQKTVTIQRPSQNLPLPTQLVIGEKATAICLVPKVDASTAVLPDQDLLRQILGATLQLGFPINYVRAVAAGGVGTGLTVDDIKLKGEDLTQQTIEQIYYKAPPRFAVYATQKRVMVQYADDNLLEAKQRGDMASLNGLRSQISGLIDGWQNHKSRKKQCKAAKYNARVAAALNLCLEGDGINAFSALQEVKADIVDERASWGRFEYLMSALVAAFFYCVVMGGLQTKYGPDIGDALNIFRAAQAGAIGAFFSIAIAIRQRTVLTDLRWVDNAADAALRITIGVIAAAVLCLLFRTNLAPPLSLGGATSTPVTGPAVKWDIVVTFGFIAGFLERLVPDMLSKMATSSGNGTPKK